VRFVDSVPGGVLAEVRRYVVMKPEDSGRSRFNRCCDELLEQMEADDHSSRRAALCLIKGQALRLSKTLRGRRVIERALEIARRGEEQESLITELRGHVLELALSLPGSKVLQSCLELLPPHQAHFIVSEIENDASNVALEDHGYGVLCRILEYTPPTLTVTLAETLLSGPGGAAALCNDERGYAVLESLLEYGLASVQENVCLSLAVAASSLKGNPVAVKVVGQALLSPRRPGRAALRESFLLDLSVL